MIVLGIESSCDETAAAIVSDKHEILGESCFLRKNTRLSAAWFPKLPPVRILNILTR